ncbi:MAG: hypothetical protein V1870_01330 [Candidatus Aenigmatarchaeota archaeon]
MELIKEVLGFEKKKLILSIFLIAVFVFVVGMNAMYGDQIDRETSKIVDNSLDQLKWRIYNTSLNGTDKYIEAKIWSNAQLEENNRKLHEFMPIIVSSGVGEGVLNMFGMYPNGLMASIGSSGNFGYNYVITETDFAIQTNIVRLVVSGAFFIGSSNNENTTIGKIFASNCTNKYDNNGKRICYYLYPEKIKPFIYSEQGQNPYSLCNEILCNITFEYYNDKKNQQILQNVSLSGFF